MDTNSRIKELVEILNKASRAYYQEAKEIMTNFEYDKLYDELLALEEKTGVILSNSPTQNVGYEVVSELPKEKHSSLMLSLDKTKEVDALVEFIKDKKGFLSWKLDGLTIVLTYLDGKLLKAVTRGNGEIGEVVTPNAKVFANIPLTIPYKKELVIRGEAIIKYSDFEKINSQIDDIDSKYKNPRNLCSGSVRQLNSEITAKRNVNFMAFSFISADVEDINIDTDSKNSRMNWLKELGFDVVESKEVNKDNMKETVEWFANEINNSDFPSDGLVLTFDSISYSESLGKTSKFPKDSIAFKWKDEQAKTILKEIEWGTSRTGLINPVAIFEPVELEGTKVSRASVHNLSIVEELELGIGDEIMVYKANMIIPQISENLTRSSNITIPDKCGVCGQPTEIHNENGVKTLHCTNKNCSARKLKAFTLFVSRNAMNIDGLSESTLEKFIANGYIHNFVDIFQLNKYKDEIINMEGFGERSYEKLIASAENAKNVSMPKFIYSLGIPNIGLANAKLICEYLDYDIDRVINAKAGEIADIPGLGDVIGNGYEEYFMEESNKNSVNELLGIVNIEKVVKDNKSAISGKVFVITGSVNHFNNRNELRDEIEKLGGKVASSVSKNTSFLINNDKESSSSKNKKAKELGVEIISEDDFIKMVGMEGVLNE